MAAQPSGVSTTPPSLVSSANLLMVHSNSSSSPQGVHPCTIREKGLYGSLCIYKVSIKKMRGSPDEAWKVGGASVPVCTRRPLLWTSACSAFTYVGPAWAVRGMDGAACFSALLAGRLMTPSRVFCCCFIPRIPGWYLNTFLLPGG